jgi:hypothetical protein
MFARFPNGTGTLFAVLGAFVALAPCLGSGCGGQATAAASQPDGSVEASVDAGVIIGTVGHVITTGGGVATGGSSGSVTNPFGGSSSGGSSETGSPDDSGSTNDDSGIASDDGSMADGPSSGDGSGGNGDGGGCSSYPPLVCGGGPCDLGSHTCCVTVQLAERCLAGTGAVCNSMKEASVHCSNACDCPTGQSCCGTIDLLSDSVQSTCQTLNPSVSGGNCPPYPATVSQASGQLCFVDSECQNGQACIYQTCIYGAQFHICGLQSQSPFNCVASPTGDGG